MLVLRPLDRACFLYNKILGGFFYVVRFVLFSFFSLLGVFCPLCFAVVAVVVLALACCWCLPLPLVALRCGASCGAVRSFPCSSVRSVGLRFGASCLPCFGCPLRLAVRACFCSPCRFPLLLRLGGSSRCCFPLLWLVALGVGLGVPLLSLRGNNRTKKGTKPLLTNLFFSSII